MEKRLTISSKLENICLVEKLIDEVSDVLQLSSELYGKVLIATVEAVNNGIVHGNKLRPDKKVEVILTFQSPVLRILINDQGSGFDYSSVPDPTTPENIENIHGRGVFLMQHLSDSVSFDNNGSTVELIFNL
ncbi:ATP-binding protein [Williamwhitmania taraxaci]|uniref:Serine/threonine-protein kinase RsbW n=1 Tax=Williamwhitmania taraxaci TaxID=1640674 RepID=A0A1G6GYN5_9BACT|nr:ATP-binding protein [Williamwhitmania taraxaci]SDB86785.1 serine/threonine-protein kinase RsbW [Williamwhitmania taraxaci]